MLLRAVQLRRDFWDNHNALGTFYLRLGRLDDARKCFNKAIELSPPRCDVISPSILLWLLCAAAGAAAIRNAATTKKQSAAAQFGR